MTVEIPGVGEVEFPASMSRPQIDAAAAKLYREAQSKSQPIAAKTSGLDTLIDLLPAAGGTVGGFVGKVPGARIASAAVGGAAGQGYKELFQHLSELPGAVKDVAYNLLPFPASLSSAAKFTDRGATPRGFAEGATAGGKEALRQAAIQGGSQAVGEGLTAGVTKGAKAVYRGYLKPSLAERMVPKANEIVDTALREGIPISRGGVAASNQVIRDLRGEVTQILNNSPETVDLHDIADRVRSFAKARYFKPGAEAADYKAAMNVADSIDSHAALGLKPGVKVTKLPASLSQADDVKRTLDTSIGEAAFGTESGAAKTTKKFARRTIRTAMEAKAPDIAPLNARESQLIDVARTIRRAVERGANHDKILGVKSLASAAYGGSAYARGDDPATAAAKALGARMLLTPAAQSYAAIVASRLAKQVGITAAMAARLAVYAMSEPEHQPQQ